MPDFVSLTCPSCNGNLKITNDIERFACGYCGNEYLVKRGGGIVTLAPILEGIKNVQIGVDKTASELALQRLKEEANAIEGAIYGFTASKNPYNFQIGKLIVGIPCILLLLYLFQSVQLVLVIGLVVLGFYIWGLVINVKKQREFDENKNIQLNDLTSQLNQKIREIEYHKDVVKLTDYPK